MAQVFAMTSVAGRLPTRGRASAAKAVAVALAVALASVAVLALVLAVALAAALAVGPATSRPAASAPPAKVRDLPERLSATGLFAAGQPHAVANGILPYVPQYPLWSDGATKLRWIQLPDGAAIDARDPDAWQFPIGTRFWKQFSFGRRVETRYMERLPDGSFRYATYLWSQDGRDASLVSASEGARARLQDGTAHELPRESDCRSCHEGRRSPVLGFGALQLSPDRDPLAPHREPPLEGAVDLNVLAARGLLTGFPEPLLREPPRIRAEGERERAALGYLFGNCSGCHNAEGPIAVVGLDFDQRLGGAGTGGPFATAVGKRSSFLIPKAATSLRIAPGSSEASAVAFRMGSRFSAWQMPPLGTRVVDDEALELVRDWISHDLPVVHERGEHR
jgi:hypothetical protein